MNLSTPRLILRDLTHGDVTPLNRIESDPRVARYMAFDPQTLEQTREYIERALAQQVQQPRLTFDLAIVPVGSSELVGRCGLEIRRPEHREATVWYLLSPDCRGRGWAGEAVGGLLDFAFGPLNLHRVWADCDPRNTPSCRLVERLGMRLEGRLRENWWLHGEWCDSNIYGILADEWAARVRG
ncbi:MAG: GNAT family N-acetyltransferase [Planctomycetia bacterium]|nr:MAG: GNAT family N-acetyltransferase [Planctomycetia bacterium]